MKSSLRIAAIIVVLVCAGVALLRPRPAVTASTAGQITGTVKLEGQAPHPKPIDMSKDPSCAQTRGGVPASLETVVVGQNGELANVVIYISQGLGGNVLPSAQPVTFEQKGCRYVPHVVAVNPGQHMKILNEDKTMHNIHPDPKPGGGNSQFNKSQLSGGAPIDVTWNAEEVPIPVKCNVHPWMRGYIVVVKGPNGVTDTNGSFTLNDVPPGTYTLTAWHEIYGTQTKAITVAAGKPVTADFTFKTK